MLKTFGIALWVVMCGVMMVESQTPSPTSLTSAPVAHLEPINLPPPQQISDNFDQADGALNDPFFQPPNSNGAVSVVVKNGAICGDTQSVAVFNTKLQPSVVADFDFTPSDAEGREFNVAFANDLSSGGPLITAGTNGGSQPPNAQITVWQNGKPGPAFFLAPLNNFPQGSTYHVTVTLAPTSDPNFVDVREVISLNGTPLVDSGFVTLPVPADQINFLALVVGRDDGGALSCLDNVVLQYTPIPGTPTPTPTPGPTTSSPTSSPTNTPGGSKKGKSKKGKKKGKSNGKGKKEHGEPGKKKRGEGKKKNSKNEQSSPPIPKKHHEKKEKKEKKGPVKKDKGK